MLKIFDLKADFSAHNSTSFNPRICWKTQTSGKGQTGYRIIVARSKANAASGVGDVFDSGVVQSSECLCRDCGLKLAPRTVYYLRVTAYSGAESCDSDVTELETAPAETDFLGTWMAMPVNNQGGTALFRKRVTLKDLPVVRARAYICGLGYHELFINGVKAGKAVLGPAVTDYSKRMYYNTYDITPMLQSGDNVLGIEVGHGWLGSKKALAQFYIEYKDGSGDEFHSSTNNGWWVGGSPTVNNSVYGGETYDARKEDVIPKNWATADFEPQWNTGWMFTVFSPKPTARLLPQPMEDIEVCDVYPVVSVTEKGDGVFVYDVGANIAGWARIRVCGERGAKVTISYGERLDDNGFVNRINLRTAAATDEYILSGVGEEEYAPRFTYHGFQYIQASVSGKAEILSLVGEHVHTATRRAGSFECSDTRLNTLHTNAVRTELNNQHSVLTDCPQRDERFGWLNDLGARLYQTVYNCGMERFFPKMIADITDTQAPDGGIADTAPFYTGLNPADPVSVAYVMAPVWCYRYYGDSSVIEREYENIKAWVDCLLGKSKDYIMTYTYYGDWVYPACYESERADGLCISTLCLYWQLTLMVAAAKIAGNVRDEKTYKKHAENCLKAINEKYFNKEGCYYSRNSQAENAMALTLNIVPAEYRRKLQQNLYENVVRHGHHSTCGNVGYRHLFYALCDAGHCDEALKVLTNPEYPGWGFMLENGATSVWERWESEMDVEMDSFDHPMFGSFDAMFYRYLGGINVCDDAVGADKITVSPNCPDSLTYVNCSFDTVRGLIVSNWKREGDKIRYHIEIPSGVTAKVTLGGKKLTLTEGKYDL